MDLRDVRYATRQRVRKTSGVRRSANFGFSVLSEVLRPLVCLAHRTGAAQCSPELGALSVLGDPEPKELGLNTTIEGATTSAAPVFSTGAADPEV